MTQQSGEFDMDQLLDEAEQGYQNLYRGQVVDGEPLLFPAGAGISRNSSGHAGFAPG